MVVLMLIWLLLSAPEPPDQIHGFAVHYAKGVFERVERVRGLKHASCNVASPFHTIGDYVRVTGDRTHVSRVCRVSDTSQPRDKPRHIRQRTFELDYYSAMAVCGKWFRSRRLDCPITVDTVKRVKGKADAKRVRRLH